MEVKIKILREPFIVPKYATPGSSGFDIHMVEDVYVHGHKTLKIPLGFALELPEGYELQLRLRSSVALDTPLRIPNAPATIDSDYRGEVCVIIENTSAIPWKLKRGERIVQGVISKVEPQVSLKPVSVLTKTIRGRGGFGSTTDKLLKS